MQAWRCATEDSGQVQLPSSPRGYCTLCKIRVHLNLLIASVASQSDTHPKSPRTCPWGFIFSLFILHFSLTRGLGKVISNSEMTLQAVRGLGRLPMPALKALDRVLFFLCRMRICYIIYGKCAALNFASAGVQK